MSDRSHWIKIEYKDEWLWRAEHFFAECERLGKKDFKVDEKRTSKEISIDGKLGEWAACWYFGGKPDYEVHPGGDAGHDFVVKGVRFDPKSTREMEGVIPFWMEKPLKADILVLVIVDDLFCHLAGWVTQRRFEVENVQKDLGYGLRKTMEQRNLSVIRDLKAFITMLPVSPC